MHKFKNLVDTVDRVATWMTYLTVTVMVSMVALQVVMRYLLHNSFSFTEELARYMFIWSVALGSALALKERKHVSVSVIVDMFPSKLQRIVRTGADALAVIFFILLLVFGIVMVVNTRAQTTPGLGISIAFVYLAIPVSAAILIIDGIYNALIDLAGLENSSSKGEE